MVGTAATDAAAVAARPPYPHTNSISIGFIGQRVSLGHESPYSSMILPGSLLISTSKSSVVDKDASVKVVVAVFADVVYVIPVTDWSWPNGSVI